MRSSDVYFKRSKGAKLIKQYCYDYAEQIGISLESVSWSTDHDKDTANKILTISTKSNTTEINFNREEIENYPGRTGTETNQLKIKKAINRKD